MRDGPGYLPLYVDDYEAATAHLTLEEDGAYMRLLRLCWRQPDGTIPNDPAWIMRRLRLDPATFERVVAPLIAEFFSRRGKRIFQKRLLAELAFANDFSAKQRSNGKKGGLETQRRNRLKNKENTSSDAQATLKPESSPHPIPSHPIKEDTTAAAPGARARDDAPKIVALPGGRDQTRDAAIDGVIEMVCQHSAGGIAPAAWLNPGARILVAKWLDDLGLTPGEVRQVAEAQIGRHGKPPGKPQWWDGPMQAFAAAKVAPPLEIPSTAPRASPAQPTNALAKIRARLAAEEPPK